MRLNHSVCERGPAAMLNDVVFSALYLHLFLHSTSSNFNSAFWSGHRARKSASNNNNNNLEERLHCQLGWEPSDFITTYYCRRSLFWFPEEVVLVVGKNRSKSRNRLSAPIDFTRIDALASLKQHTHTVEKLAEAFDCCERPFKSEQRMHRNWYLRRHFSMNFPHQSIKAVTTLGVSC